MLSGGAEGVLITGVYGSGKSSIAAEIGYLLEQRDELYGLLDLDYLGWIGDHEMGFRMMLRNLVTVAANFREVGARYFVVAYFVRDREALTSVTAALGVPTKVVRVEVPLREIEQRLSADVTSGRQDDLRDAAAALASSAGVGIEDLAVRNDRPVPVIARELMSWLGWDRRDRPASAASPGQRS